MLNAIKLLIFAFFKILSPHLELKLNPAFVITGTFFHKASKVVVTPLNGKVSRHRSIFFASIAVSFIIISRNTPMPEPKSPEDIVWEFLIKDKPINPEVLKNIKVATYEINMKRILKKEGTAVGLANGILSADGKIIYTAENLKVGLFKS